jgi:hypothetical protein
MTHTLHRMGTDPKLLKEDYVVLVMPSKDINHVGSGPKLRRFFELAIEAGAIKIGDCRSGNEYYQGGTDKVLENVEDRAVVHAVFKDREAVTRVLAKLKQEDLGMSVVVSGLFDEVRQACHDVGLTPHTINQSLGRWGRTEKLPRPEVLEIHTMCGHGMVSTNLILSVAKKVKDKKISAEKGSEQLFRPCMCGIFNPYKACHLLVKLADVL